MTTRNDGTSRQGCLIYAVDKVRVSAFYQRALGLSVEESEPTHDLLVGDAGEVVVHAIPPEHAASITFARPVEPRDETPIKPVFVVASLDAVRVAATETGGHLHDVERAWRFRGFLVLDGWDPEGNVVQFRQPE